MAEFKAKNPNAFREMEVRMKELEKFVAKAGWFETDKYTETGTPVAYVASIQELGHGPIPPRPFMRPAFEKGSKYIQEIAGQFAKRILEGKMTGREAMGKIGEQARADIENAIIAVNAPPLSETTMVARLFKRKYGREITGSVIGEIKARLAAGEQFDFSGISPKPLNDTGHMLASVTNIVEEVS